MRRFVRSFTAAILTVLVIGAMVIGATGGVTGGDTGEAEGALQAQTEDSDEPEDSAEPATVALAPIEALLERLTPSAEGSALPSAQRIVLSRDPFQPVVPEPAGEGTDDGADDGTGDGTDDGTDDGSDDTAGESDPCTGDETEIVCDGTVITLDGFTADGLAIVTVDGTGYTVDVEDEFAMSFQVLAINDPCVTLLFGDEAFSICTGTTVLK